MLVFSDGNSCPSGKPQGHRSFAQGFSLIILRFGAALALCPPSLPRLLISILLIVGPIALMLGPFALSADSLPDSASQERLLQNAEDRLLADPKESLRIVEKLRSGMPMQRGDRMPAARLAIEVNEDDKHLQVLIRDFGRGLDWSRIQAIAAEKNFRPREGRPLSDVLFLSGTSTSDQVSATSGRGVGLDVIAGTCEQLRGEVLLLDNDSGPGTRLIMRWPLPALALSA